MWVRRTFVDEDSRQNVQQVGCAILLDGERIAEAFEQVGPFDDWRPALQRCCEDASALAAGQLRGQLRLL